MSSEKLRALIIDDSTYNRRAIGGILESSESIVVAGVAVDGSEGVKRVLELKPDVITLDLMMPRMDGFAFLRVLREQAPTPVVVISSSECPDDVLMALELGAFDFVAKSEHFFPGEVPDELKVEIISKVMAAAMTQGAVSHLIHVTSRIVENLEALVPTEVQELRKLVCIGASTGGPQAIRSVLGNLPRSADTALLVVQHMPRGFTAAFADRLNRYLDFRVLEPKGGETVRSGHIYVAPGGLHMLVEVDGKTRQPKIVLETPVGSEAHCPSVDRLFASAATLSFNVLGVVLTGMGTDGQLGAEAIYDCGGTVVAESAESAIVFGMPSGVIATGKVTEVLHLDDIHAKLLKFLSYEI